MFVRCTSIFVAIAYIAGQMLLLPHSHADNALSVPAKCHSTPHFHIGVACDHDHSHSHGHSHSHSGESHDVQQDAHEDAPSQDHDSTAVYASCNPSDSLPVPATDWSADLLVDAGYIDTTSSLAGLSISPAPELYAGESKPDQPLWLALRALRI